MTESGSGATFPAVPEDQPPWVYESATIGGVEMGAFSLTLRSPAPRDFGSIDTLVPFGEIHGTAEITLSDPELRRTLERDPETLHTVEISREWMVRHQGWRGWIDWLLRRKPVKHTLVTTIPDVQFVSTPLESTDATS